MTKLVNVHGDGNCFYYAFCLSILVQTWNTEHFDMVCERLFASSPAEIGLIKKSLPDILQEKPSPFTNESHLQSLTASLFRKRLMDFVDKNLALYLEHGNPLIESFPSEASLKQHISSQRKTEEYAIDLEVDAAARFMKINIDVDSPDGTRSFKGIAPEEAEWTTTLHLSQIQIGLFGHYQCHLPTDTLAPSTAVVSTPTLDLAKFNATLLTHDVNVKMKAARKYFDEKSYYLSFTIIKNALALQPSNERILEWMGLIAPHIDSDHAKRFDYFDSMASATYDDEVADLIVYPKEGFNGDRNLTAIRSNLNSDYSGPLRVAANFLGVPLCSSNTYFFKTPYHRFPIDDGETYHRSAKNPFAKFVKTHATFGDKKDGVKASHLGLFRTPTSALEAHLGISSTADKPTSLAKLKASSATTTLYDDLLKYKKMICAYVADKCDENAYLQVGFYHDYPCIMVHVSDKATFKELALNPPSFAALEAWANTLISFFVALVNHKAKLASLSIELVRRSSFGFLTPTIAPCGRSFRINVGVVPIIYAGILIKALKDLTSILDTIHNKLEELDKNLPEEIFFKNPKYSSVYYPAHTELPKTLLELFYFQAEKGGKTTIQNLVRTALARDTLMTLFFNELARKPDATFIDLANKIFSILRNEISNIFLQDSTTITLSYQPKSHKPPETLSIRPITPPPLIDEPIFWKIVESLKKVAAEKIATPPITKDFLRRDAGSRKVREQANLTLSTLTECIKQKKLNCQLYDGEEYVPHGRHLVPTSIFLDCDLFFDLAMLNELLLASAIIRASLMREESYASDSDIEDKESHPVFGKKVIVQNGMQAIIGALEASKTFLKDSSLEICIHSAYYETEDAYKLLGGFKKVDLSSKPKILILDSNPCITDKTPLTEPCPIQDLPSSIEICVIDTTSATTSEYQKYLSEFRQSKKVKILFFVSSGLKNEQSGLDRNPYGTIRIFTKNRDLLSSLMTIIYKQVTLLEGIVPHTLRRMMKEMGHVPTNSRICGC